MAVPHAKPKNGQIPSLEGIRAVAVGLVFLAHSGLEKYIPGGFGVTVFFVLSGYLITTLMRTEFAQTQTIDFQAFYMRRILRLMPPLLIVVIGAGIAHVLAIRDGQLTVTGMLSVLFYFGNYYIMSHDYQGLPSGLGVVWSLAVEEHYYLFYPPLALWMMQRGSRAVPVIVLTALAAAVLGWRCWLVWHGASELYVNMATDTRMDAIFIGCLLAFARNPWLDSTRTRSSAADAGVALASLGMLAFSLIVRNAFFRDTFRYTIQALAVAPLIWLAVARADWRAFRWLNAKPAQYVGTISYTLYLVHFAIFIVLFTYAPRLGWLSTTTVTAVVCIGIAELMRRYVEVPCGVLRRALHEKRRSEAKRGGTIVENAMENAMENALNDATVPK